MSRCNPNYLTNVAYYSRSQLSLISRQVQITLTMIDQYKIPGFESELKVESHASLCLVYILAIYELQMIKFSI